MDYYQKIVEQLKQAVLKLQELLRQKQELEQSKTNAIRFYERALTFLGRDASPRDEVSDYFACVESINNIHEAEFGFPVGGQYSTYWMQKALAISPYFKEVSVNDLDKGDILIFPTGSGTRRFPNGQLIIPSGHVLVCAGGNLLMSNDSASGNFMQNYSIDSAMQRWVKDGGYSVFAYRRL